MSDIKILLQIANKEKYSSKEEVRENLLIALKKEPKIEKIGLNIRRKNPDFDLLKDEFFLDQFYRSQLWLTFKKRTKKPNKEADSYKIKHLVEEYSEKILFTDFPNLLLNSYVSNGACIAALVINDFILDGSSINPCVNLSKKELKI